MRKAMNTARILVCILALGALGRTALAEQKDTSKEFTVSGIMQHTELEGGCWFLQTKTEKYELTGSPEDLAKCYVEGRPLTLRVVLRPFMASTCMIGKRIEIIAVLDTVFHARDPLVMTHRITGRVHRTKAGCWYVLTKEKFRYELQEPIPKRYKRIGAKFDKVTKFLEGREGKCEMNGVIVFPMDEQPPKGGGIVPKRYDPR